MRTTDHWRPPNLDPHTAAETLRAALDDVGLVFPTLKADDASPNLALVELGRVRADVAMRLANTLRQGMASHAETENAEC